MMRCDYREVRSKKLVTVCRVLHTLVSVGLGARSGALRYSFDLRLAERPGAGPASQHRGCYGNAVSLDAFAAPFVNPVLPAISVDPIWDDRRLHPADASR